MLETIAQTNRRLYEKGKKLARKLALYTTLTASVVAGLGPAADLVYDKLARQSGRSKIHSMLSSEAEAGIVALKWDANSPKPSSSTYGGRYEFQICWDAAANVCNPPVFVDGSLDNPLWVGSIADGKTVYFVVKAAEWDDAAHTSITRSGKSNIVSTFQIPNSPGTTSYLISPENNAFTNQPNFTLTGMTVKSAPKVIINGATYPIVPNNKNFSISLPLNNGLNTYVYDDNVVRLSRSITRDGTSPSISFSNGTYSASDANLASVAASIDGQLLYMPTSGNLIENLPWQAVWGGDRIIPIVATDKAGNTTTKNYLVVSKGVTPFFTVVSTPNNWKPNTSVYTNLFQAPDKYLDFTFNPSSQTTEYNMTFNLPELVDLTNYNYVRLPASADRITSTTPTFTIRVLGVREDGTTYYSAKSGGFWPGASIVEHFKGITFQRDNVKAVQIYNKGSAAYSIGNLVFMPEMPDSDITAMPLHPLDSMELVTKPSNVSTSIGYGPQGTGAIYAQLSSGTSGNLDIWSEPTHMPDMFMLYAMNPSDNPVTLGLSAHMIGGNLTSVGSKVLSPWTEGYIAFNARSLSGELQGLRASFNGPVVLDDIQTIETERPYIGVRHDMIVSVTPQ